MLLPCTCAYLMAAFSLKACPATTLPETLRLWRQRINIATLKQLQMKGPENFLGKWRFTVWLHLKYNNVDIWPKALQVLWPSSINHTIKAVSLSQHDLQRCSKGIFSFFFLPPQQNRPWQQNCKFSYCEHCYTPGIITVIINVRPNLEDEPEHLGLKWHTLGEMKSL